MADGRVVVDDSGAGPVRSLAEFPGAVEPGAELPLELALEGTPKTEDRIILCNGVGDYQHGRYAVLRFDR